LNTKAGYRNVLVILILSLMLMACGSTSSGPPGSDDPAPPGGAEPTGTAGDANPVPSDLETPAPPQPTVPESSGEYTGPEVEISVWTYPQDDASLKAYEKEFEQQNPKIRVKVVRYPEDGYVTKVNTALQAHKPPDVAVMENRAWMKAKRTVELTQYFPLWGVSVSDFNPGGLSRATTEGNVKEGVYGVGDFLGGNIIFYNKQLFKQAGVEPPPTDRSLTFAEYAEICRKLAKPDKNPGKAVYGCSVPDWGYGIQSRDVFGADGHKAEGNMNSAEMARAWNLGTALVRDKMAPSASFLGTLSAGESDLFAQNRLGMTWSDFTEANKYKTNKIDFGLAPFFVLREGESFVDTWTAPWGTFTESKNKEAALVFLRFMATEAQRIRMQVSADPPLSQKVADELGYGKDDPVKQQYLEVLKNAKAQVFVPPGVEAWNPAEIERKMTVGKQTESKPLLDAAAKQSQAQLDRAWRQWERLGRE